MVLIFMIQDAQLIKILFGKLTDVVPLLSGCEHGVCVCSCAGAPCYNLIFDRDDFRGEGEGQTTAKLAQQPRH